MTHTNDSRRAALSRVFWASVYLAVSLVAVKAYYLGPPSGAGALDYLRSLAAISYLDVVFAAAAGIAGTALLAVAGRRRLTARLISFTFLSLTVFCCMYAVANVVIFGVLGGFLTYPLLSLVGDVRMIRSSIAAHATPGALGALIGLPLTYTAIVVGTSRFASRAAGRARWRYGLALSLAIVWIVFGQRSYDTDWASRSDRRIAENAHWVLVSSWSQALGGDKPVRMEERFPLDDLADFAPIGEPTVQTAGFGSSAMFRSPTVLRTKRFAADRPPNVILIVLESVAARWTSVAGGTYDTTPVLKAESAHGVVFDSVYAPIGRSSNSLASMLLSAYPRLDFRDITEEYPQLPGTSLPSLFQKRGYRTAFATPSDLHWAGWETFLGGRGFDAVLDYHDLSCPDMLSSWGVEDRCMVDAMLPVITSKDTRPFFLMGWTTQTHHPYEPSPDVPFLNLVREQVGADEYDLGRYLNVLHETDRQLGRLFETLRQTGLDRNTLVVVTGDHGQAFGYPHDTYIQGRTVYQEDVNVPLLFWFPRLYGTPVRSNVVGGLVDIPPTIAELAGLTPAADWQGRSLFDKRRSDRAYFYVAEDHYTLGVREGRWKYSLALREGDEELFDLARDPDEQHNLASAEPARSARLRQHLAAWTEANRQQYDRLQPVGH